MGEIYGLQVVFTASTHLCMRVSAVPSVSYLLLLSLVDCQLFSLAQFPLIIIRAAHPRSKMEAVYSNSLPFPFPPREFSRISLGHWREVNLQNARFYSAKPSYVRILTGKIFSYLYYLAH